MKMNMNKMIVTGVLELIEINDNFIKSHFAELNGME